MKLSKIFSHSRKLAVLFYAVACGYTGELGYQLNPLRLNSEVGNMPIADFFILLPNHEDVGSLVVHGLQGLLHHECHG